MAVCFAPHFPQSFLPLCYALKNTLEKTFSTCVRLHFSASFILFFSPFLFLRVHERQIISLSYMDSSKPFCGGVSQKFLPLHYRLESYEPFVGVFHKNFYMFSLSVLKILYLIKKRHKKADDCLPSTINNFICFYNK